MLLTVTTTHTPTTDLGYLLHKNPAKAQTFSLGFGEAHVFYPEVSEGRCTAALLLDIDPVGLVRGRRGPSGAGRTLESYVNDRPYVASSFMSTAIAQVFGSALGGRSKERADLVDVAIPLEARVSVLPCRGGEAFLRGLFEPLRYAVKAEGHALDEKFSEWGPSRYFTVTLSGMVRLQQLLSHLYVLMPVLDDDKHYWVGEDEIEKLLRFGEGWLTRHPLREQIVDRYLRRRKHLSREALERLLAEESPAEAKEELTDAPVEEAKDEKVSLHAERLGAVLAVLKASGAKRVLDLGCGEGKLLCMLLAEKRFESILGMDVSHRVLEIASDRLRLETMPEKQRARVTLMQGSLTYRDKRLERFEAAAVVEVIEHLDAARLAAFERVLFEFARPEMVVLTTPNREYNVKWETLPAGAFRHGDHRFEWTRAEFEAWGIRVAKRFGYRVEFLPVGPVDADVGAPSQMATFRTGGAA